VPSDCQASEFADDIEEQIAWKEFPEEYQDKHRVRVEKAGLSYFRDLVGALVEFKARREQRIQKGFYQTAIVKKSGLFWITLAPKENGCRGWPRGTGEVCGCQAVLRFALGSNALCEAWTG